MRLLHSSSVLAFVNHCWAIKVGKLADVYIANNILNRYIRSELNVARKLFDEMSYRDIVTWNTMIAGYVNYGQFGTAWFLLKTVKRFGLEIDAYTFGSLLKGVSYDGRLDVGQQLHSLIVKTGFEENVYAASALLDMYAKSGRIGDAVFMFQRMPQRNPVSWNALISGFAQVGDRETAFSLLDGMERDGVWLDDGTFSPLLALLDGDEFYATVMQLHCKVIKCGLEFYNTVFNSMITSYSECGSLGDAERVFEEVTLDMGARDVITWNSMLSAYLVHHKQEASLKLFLDMRRLGFEPDVYTYTSVISAWCIDEAQENNHQGKSLHGLVVKTGMEQSVPVCNSVISMYMKSNNKNSMSNALKVFESMKSKDRVTWNSILTGFSQFGCSEDALQFFAYMRFLLMDIDHYAFSAVLRSCSDLATLQLGQQIHSLTVKFGLESNDFVASSLIFMYSKCGVIEDAQKCFDETPQDTSITWNSIMFAYAQHGNCHVALEFFFLMRDKKVKIDHITFVALLTACSHSGLVEEGRHFLKSMESDYRISPRMEHYACAVDLLGRAGHLDEAKALIESMPFEPDVMVWKTFLGACRACGDIELAAQVASHLLEIEPEEHCTYVILSNMYGRMKKWDDKACLTKLMRQRKVKKVPGWSWIEVKNKVYTFGADDQSHDHSEEIHRVLGEVMEEIKWLDSLADLDLLVHNWAS